MRTARATTGSRLLMIAAALLAACGTAVTPEHEGVPLATVSGQITSDGTVDVGDGLRLALVWTPTMGDGRVKGLVTQDVTYQGSFPQQYKFDIYSPPPPEALSDWSEQKGPESVAIGKLVAYRDLNGNGQLDTIKADGIVHDKVVGTSADFRSDEGGYLILFIGSEIPESSPWHGTGFTQGFNLLHFPAGEDEGELVPLTTPVPIKLVDRPHSNLIICEELYTPDIPSDATEVVDIDSHVCGVPVEVVETGLFAEITLIDDVFEAVVALYGEDEVDELAIKIGGRELALQRMDEETVVGFQSGPSAGFLAPGASSSLEIFISGQRAINSEFRMPGDFSITSPVYRATLPVGEAVTATWTRSEGAAVYDVEIETASGFEDGDTVESQSHSLVLPAKAVGPAILRVSAVSLPVDDSMVITRVTRSVEVNIEQ